MFRLHKIFITATVLFAAAGCVDEIIDIPVVEDTVVGEGGTVSGLVPMTISAIETKTTLSGTTVKWSANDKVAVFDLNSEKREFSAGTISGDGTSAEFSGKVTVGTTDFYAVYPYSLAQTEASGVLTVTLPSDQTYKNGSFADNHNIAVAKGTAVTEGSGAYSGDLVSHVSFKNVCGLLKFTVPDHIAVARKIKIESSSANIAGTMSINYSGSTPSASIKADGSKDVTISGEFASGSTCYFVVAPDSLGTIKVTVSSADNELYAKQSTKSLTIAAGQIIDLGDIDFVTTPACEAIHTYSYGMLTGTEVQFNLGMDGNMEQFVTDLEISMTNSNNTVVRSYSSATAENKKVALIPQNNWSYLPKGEYKLSISYKMNGITFQRNESFTLDESPNVSIKVSAETSYSRYQNYINKVSGATLDLANTDGTGNKVMNIKAEINISNDILAHSNYADILEVTFTFDGHSLYSGTYKYEISPNQIGTLDTSGLLDGVNIINQAYGNHTLYGAMTFDGVSSDMTLPCHVTGIPYVKNFGSDSDITGWEWSGSETEHKKLGYQLFFRYFGTTKKTNAFSPTFHIPTNTDIENKTIFIARSDAGNKRTEYGHTGITNGKNVKVDSTITLEENGDPHSLTHTGTMTSANNRISVSVTGGEWDGPAQRHYIYINYLSVHYN